MLWEDEPAQQSFHSSLFRSISARRHLCVHSSVHTCTPTPNGCLSSEAGILKACNLSSFSFFSLALRPKWQNTCARSQSKAQIQVPTALACFRLCGAAAATFQEKLLTHLHPKKCMFLKQQEALFSFKRGNKEAGNTRYEC